MPTPNSDPMHTAIITPTFSDVDGFRHINNTRLAVWFELGRCWIYELFQPEFDYDRCHLTVAHTSVDFLAPMSLGQDVEVRTTIEKVGRSSVTCVQEAWQGGQACARGKAVLVHYDFGEQRSLPISEELRAALLEHESPHA